MKKLIIKLLISSILLTLIFLNVDKKAFSESFALLNLKFIPLIFLLLIANYIFSSIRWKALLVFKNSETVSLKYLISLYFTGAFFNNFMPTSMGGDVYKVYKLGKKLNNTVDAFTATFMERFTGVIALILISIFSLIDLLGLWGIILLVVFVVGSVVAYYTLSFLSSKHTLLKKVYDSISTYRGKTRVLLISFITSIVVQFISIYTQYFIFIGMSQNIPATFAYFTFPVISLAGFFVPSLNGVGVQDGLYMKFFETVGIASTVSLSASVLYHLFRLGVSLIGGFIYAFNKDD